ncbi:ATP-, maltotriose-and DNA-dependent transcriptional regulator MalT [Lentzea albidocapillata]|uniref:ATP-, maltotriose-and DNA-dependent transcriptional regulator MalT n=1 Tax=Lentzea albidocapillata TaxID=40571 RepID=A0A1W2EVT5_9PSEU|nr:ATP-, maltotriose-and DNA-dependent transcriptional regulator MalT [Lentzea albidocapillata]
MRGEPYLGTLRVVWPFVGRVRELEDVMSTLTSGNGAALVGPAGVGKTRLTDEVVARLEHSGLAVRRCYATVATSTIPFGAMAAMLPADMRTANPLGRAVEHLLSEQQPLVIVVDDAHLLDDASIALLSHVIRHGHARVLVTSRPGESTELWQEGPLRRYPLGDLSRAESDLLLEQALGEPVDARSAALLWSASAGNPLYLRELVMSGRALGTLPSDDGIWSWHGAIELGGRLAELVRSNLGRLEPSHRHALELLACSEPVELDLLASLVHEEALDDLETRGLIRVVPSGRRTVVRLGHPLYGSLLRATCPTLRARAHQRALATALEATGARRREDLMRIATWRLDGGSPISVTLLAAAAEQAWAAQDVTLAERLCRAAVEAGGLNRVGHVFGQVLMHGHEPSQAEATLADVMAGPLSAEDLSHLAATRSMNLHFGLGDADAAAAMLDTVDVPGLPADVHEWLQVVRVILDAQHHHVATVLERTYRPVAPQLSVHMQRTRALCLLHAGRYREVAQEITAYEALEDPAEPDDGALRMRCFALAFAGHLADAEALALTMYDRSFDDLAFTGATSLYSVLSFCARMRGHGSQALRLAREGSPKSPASPLIFDVIALANLAGAAAVCGEVTLAQQTLARAEKARRPAWRRIGTTVSVTRSWVLASTGAIRAAADAAMAAADECAELGMHGSEAMALHDAARYGVDTSVRLTALTAVMDDLMTKAYASHATALAHAAPTALEAAATDFQRLGATLYAAEALAAATRLHRTQGNARAASQASARQALLMRDFDGVHTPVLRAGDLTHLTRRQAEVAHLATSGLTNQQIAERLHTSKRTVDNHLHAIYGILGVTGRDELRTVLGPARPN